MHNQNQSPASLSIRNWPLGIERRTDAVPSAEKQKSTDILFLCGALGRFMDPEGIQRLYSQVVEGQFSDGNEEGQYRTTVTVRRLSVSSV